MKRNKIMALTALLTLIGAPLSKAQEKGGSQQSTSAQSEKIANKDSKATEQVKNQGKSKDSKALQTKDSKAVDKTKDSKAPQQTKDSKTADKTKEETKKDSKNAQQTKEQPKDSEKDGKKENKNSSVAHDKDLMNRMVSLGYSIEWIQKNWSWLAKLGGIGVVSGVIGNKMGKKANVDANYVLKTDKDGIIAEAEKFGVKHTDGDLEARAQELAGDKKYTEADLDQLVKNAKKEVDDEWQQKISKGELFEDVGKDTIKKLADKDTIKELADGIGIKYTDADLANKDFLKAHSLLTEKNSNALVASAANSVINNKVSSGELVKANDQNAVKQAAAAFDMIDKNDKNAVTQAAEKFGIKYTEENLKTEAEKLANGKKYTEQELNKKVDERTDKLRENIAKLKSKFKYTEDMHKKGIVDALNQAYKLGTIREMNDTNKKKEFDANVATIATKDKRLVDSLNLIKNRLSQDFANILVKTTYGKWNHDDEKTLIEADQMVGAFVMLSDIKNALVNGMIGKDLSATIRNSANTTDAAWSKFEFKINLRSYAVFLNHSENKEFYVSNDGNNTEYLIPLK